jgi:hypothetical protein
MRRLRVLASLDAEGEQVIASRDQRQRDGVDVLVTRLEANNRLPMGNGHAVRML